MRNMLKPLRKKTDDEIRNNIKLSHFSFLLYYYAGLVILIVGMFTLYTFPLLVGGFLVSTSYVLAILNELEKNKLEIREINDEIVELQIQLKR